MESENRARSKDQSKPRRRILVVVVEWCCPVREGGRTEDPRTFMWHVSDFAGPVELSVQCSSQREGPQRTAARRSALCSALCC